MRNERSFFVLSGNCVPMKQKTFRVDRTAAETKMLLTQPAAGGESCGAGFFFSIMREAYHIQVYEDKILIY